MIISKFTPDQNSIKQELEVLNNILTEQRKLKKTLLLYLEKISEGIFNATDPQDANSLISCLNSIKKSFENLKGNISEIIELKHCLETALETNSLETFSLDEYNSKYLELSEKISDDNVFYYSFIESLLKFMQVVFPENIPEIPSEEYDYDKKIEEIAEKNILEPTSSEDTIEKTLVENLPEYDNIQEDFLSKETDTINQETVSNTENISNDESILDDELENSLLEEIIEEQLLLDYNILNNDTINDDIDKQPDTTISADNEFESSLLEEILEEQLLEESELNSTDTSDDENIIPEDASFENSAEEEFDNSEEINNLVYSEDMAEEALNITLSDDISDSLLEELIINDISETPAFEELEVPENNESIEENANSFEEIKEPEKTTDSDFVEKILVVSEKDQTAILPYSILELEECFSNNPEKYSSIQDIIDKEYTISTTNYKNTSFTRFKTAFNLAKNKSNLSFIESLNLANELFFNSEADPIIIAACKNIDELDIYLSCLADNVLEEFKCFKIKYI